MTPRRAATKISLALISAVLLALAGLFSLGRAQDDAYLLIDATGQRVIRAGRTSAQIKAAITSAQAGDTVLFVGTYDVSDWGSTPYVIDKQLNLVASGGSIATLQGDTTYADILFDIRASVRVEGLKFKQLKGAFEFNQTAGSAAPIVQIEDCEFEDVVRCLYSPDQYSATETVGITRLIVESCHFRNVNLTLDDPGLGVRVSDGQTCIELSCPLASVDITNCYAADIQKALVRIGFSNTADTDAEVVGWNRLNVSENTIRNVSAGQNGSTNNAAGIVVVGRTAIIRDNRIDTVVCGDDDEATGIFVFAGGDDGTGTASGSVVVDGNHLFNCGGRDGVISLKGDTRGAATNNPPNWKQRITNNVIAFSDAFTAARTLPPRGIWCQVEDVVIGWNVIDRAVGNAIHIVSSNEGANNLITQNLITNHRINDTSDAAIHCNAGNDLSITGNHVFVTPQSSIAGRALRLQPDADAARKRWEVRNNIFSVSGGGAASRGIMVVASSDIDVLTLEGNQFVGWQQGIRFDTGTLSRVEARGNWFDAGITTPIDLTTPPTRYTFADNPGRTPANSAFADLDATPSIARKDGIFTANYTMATPISNFDDGVNGDVITILFTGANARPQHNSNIRNQTAADYTTAGELDKRMRTWRREGGVWYELTPSTGSAVGP